jgi:AraC-like DNA-binding protein
MQIHRPNPDIGALQALIRDLSQQVPSCPVVVLLQVPPEEGLLVISRLAPLQLRAVVPHGPLMLPILRGALTDRATLPRSVIDWLRLRAIRLNPHVVDLLECFFTDAPEHADLSSLLEAHRIPQSTARFRLQKKSLPAPSQWFQLARALHAALRLQADPDASMAAVAQQMGFADHSALAHLLRRSLGVRARSIRGTLGWEWLLHRWLASRGLRIR